MIKKIVNAFAERKKKIDKGVNNFITSLKPSYAVEVDIYHVIPGVPVNSHSDRHQFGKGELTAAKGFYDKVILKTAEMKVAPAEVKLIKGKKKVVDRKHFGPIAELNKLKKKK